MVSGKYYLPPTALSTTGAWPPHVDSNRLGGEVVDSDDREGTLHHQRREQRLAGHDSSEHCGSCACGETQA